MGSGDVREPLKGPFLLVRGFSRAMMKARYGRIVNMVSVVGQHGAAGQANYAASKAGLEEFTRSVAKELGSGGLRVMPLRRVSLRPT